MPLTPMTLTTKGIDLMNKATAGQTLTFTKVKMGNGTLTAGQTYDQLNDLKNSMRQADIASVIRSGTQTTLKVSVKNTGVATGWYVREIGVFAKGADNIEVLYAVATAPTDPDYFPAETSTPVDFALNIAVRVDNASNVTATIAPTTALLASEKGAVGGVATLDATGKVPASQLPPQNSTATNISITDAADYYTGTSVEAALQEIGQTLNGTRASLIATAQRLGTLTY